MCIAVSRSSRRSWKVNEMTDLSHLMDDLTQSLTPVRAQKASRGRLALFAVAIGSIAVLPAVEGMSPAVTHPSNPMGWITLCLLALLGLAAGLAAVRLAQPQVGAPAEGFVWATAALMTIPVGALASIAGEPDLAAGLTLGPGLRCLSVGALASIGTLGFLSFWLRRGAPVSTGRASWAAGLASGAVGAIAVTLECPFNGIAHLGIWHVAVVIVVGGIVRLLLRPILRW